ncbi:RraA family protein [Parapedobacter lycopersici]|uniref:RraA family protein n=1 Tax=Parapedobacter lycopersici TaxID=1864939 RepID=UPI00214D9B43|nr:hypothetical protein [Parapedobacter lycopersici]
MNTQQKKWVKSLVPGTLCLVLALGSPTVEATAQIYQLSPEEMAHYTPHNPFDRLNDGRPRVPDAILDTIRNMEIAVVEVYALLRDKGFPNQFEGDWKVLQPGKRLVGRAFTVQFMPTRADLNEVTQEDAAAKGLGRLRNQTTIDMLESGDVAVVDLYGKVEEGTFVGDKLAYYIQKTTGTGIVIDGGLFFVEAIEKTGMPGYYRGTHPESLRNSMITGVNVPIRIGGATVMPGDVVLGDQDGLLFIPPQLVEEIITSVKTKRVRDAWSKKQFDTGKYKSAEIYGRLSPELQKDLDEFMKAHGINQ